MRYLSKGASAAIRNLSVPLIVGLLACSAPEGDKAQTEARDTPPESETELPLLCASNSVHDSSFDPEIYRPSAINAKLRRYPELAAAMGRVAVADCQSARDYMRSYAEYSRANPGFDEDEPFDLTPQALPPAPELNEASLQREKVLNGMRAENGAVVQLEYTPPNGQPGRCSGTFIAKNWILTAAHCLARPSIHKCLLEGTPITPGKCQPRFRQYNKWTIRFSNGSSIEKIDALGYVHPGWPGVLPPTHPEFVELTYEQKKAFADHDIALLYVADDTRLAPEIEPKGTPAHVLRLSATSPNASWPMSFYGWGAPLAEGKHVLRQSLPQLGKAELKVERFTVVASSLEGDSAVCGGDSGGPLVREVDIPTHHGRKTVEAVVGVTSLGLPSNACQLFPGLALPSIWTSVDQHLPWVEEQLKQWYLPTFSCARRFDVHEPIVVAECWGKPCVEDEVCGQAPAYCSQPAKYFKTSGAECSNCAGGGQSCGCIIGQCLVGKALKKVKK